MLVLASVAVTVAIGQSTGLWLQGCRFIPSVTPTPRCRCRAVAQLEGQEARALRAAEALTVLKLMALAGGFTDYAAPNRTTLIRQEGDKRVEKRVNIKDIMSDPANNEDPQLKGHALVVPAKLF